MKILRKKILVFALTFLSLFIVTACKQTEPKIKTFSGAGITVTLTENFYQTEIIQSQLYISTLSIIFIGNSEDKSLASNLGINSLDEYTKWVLTANGKISEVFTNNDGNHFQYAYYTASVEGQTFGYMLITMEGQFKYYTMNFACLESTLESNKEQFMAWAKTITVI